MLQMEQRFDRQAIAQTSYQTDLNDTELLLKPTYYGTIPSLKHDPLHDNLLMKVLKKIWSILCSEYLLSFTVIIFGIAATFTSTFYNMLDIKGLNQFWSPCIQNISLSYQLIPK